MSDYNAPDTKKEQAQTTGLNTEETSQTEQVASGFGPALSRTLHPKLAQKPNVKLSPSQALSLQRLIGNQATTKILQRNSPPKPNNTGLPDSLKTGVENLGGVSLDDVKVNYNSDQPGKMGALAYTEGADIHLAPNQEEHLAHEAWHVVQQKQGRVTPSVQLKSASANLDSALEEEADTMGSKAQELAGRLPSTAQVLTSAQALGQPMAATPARVGVRQFKNGSAWDSKNKGVNPGTMKRDQLEDQQDEQDPDYEPVGTVSQQVATGANNEKNRIYTKTTTIQQYSIRHPENVPFYVTTRPQAWQGIQDSGGMDPNFGGANSAPTSVTAFNTQGKITLGINESIARGYAKMNLGAPYVVLKVTVPQNTIVQPDPDAQNAVLTTNFIPLTGIELIEEVTAENRRAK